MASYSVVLCPLSTIMAVDFFIVKRGKYNVVDLYDPSSIYHYGRFGTNWRAVVALVFSITPNLPGMAASLNPDLDIGNLKVSFLSPLLKSHADFSSSTSMRSQTSTVVSSQRRASPRFSSLLHTHHFNQILHCALKVLSRPPLPRR